jgi:hydroxymethylpyrimidine pyrophosphatase-like HAD family hydrolase
VPRSLSGRSREFAPQEFKPLRFINLRHPHRSYSVSRLNWLLVADVDDTLLGDDGALSRLGELLARTPWLKLALNSSRPWPSVQRTLVDLDIELAYEATICAMGTDLRIAGRPVEEWMRKWAGWDRGRIDRVMGDLGFSPHAPEFQTPSKASFAVPSARWQEARRAAEATGLPVQIITSGVSDFDVLPPGAGKGEATLFLAGQLGVPAERLIVAGDSGNDLAMFAVAPRGIVVANARPELREAVDPARVYFAGAPHAEGILEGLRHYGLAPASDASESQEEISQLAEGV